MLKGLVITPPVVGRISIGRVVERARAKPTSTTTFVGRPIVLCSIACRPVSDSGNSESWVGLWV